MSDFILICSEEGGEPTEVQSKVAALPYILTCLLCLTLPYPCTALHCTARYPESGFQTSPAGVGGEGRQYRVAEHYRRLPRHEQHQVQEPRHSGAAHFGAFNICQP